MGNTQSPPLGYRVASAMRAFTRTDLDDLRSLFLSLASLSQNDDTYVSPHVFKAFFGLPGAIGTRLFDLVTQKRCDHRLTFDDFVISKAIYEKGTREQFEDFIYQVVDINDSGNFSRSELKVVLREILDDVFIANKADNGFSSYQDSLEIFIDALMYSKPDREHCCDIISFEEFKRWSDHVPSIRKILGNLLVQSSGRPGSHVPCLLHASNIDPDLLLLRREYAWHIGGMLPLHEVREWELLYNSVIHGQSFNTFLGSMLNEVAGTVLVIKDKSGYIYGGYASQHWEKHASFYGDMKCFLFQLHPKASIFKATGVNNNIQWCGVNFVSGDEIPNGVGFGGRPNHFGLFISDNFEAGHSFPCTTFGSPSLSKYPHVQPEVIECWAVMAQKHEMSKGGGEGEGTVLEKFKEDQHMLNLVGLADSTHSI